jgi:peroxiredoxin
MFATSAVPSVQQAARRDHRFHSRGDWDAYRLSASPKLTTSGVAPGLASRRHRAQLHPARRAGTSRVTLRRSARSGPCRGRRSTAASGARTATFNYEAYKRRSRNFRELDASLVAISPQAADHGLTITEKDELTFPVLSDLDQEVIRAYRIQFTLTGDLEDLQVNVFQNDPATQNADHTRSLPVPATFVIDRDGVIRAAFVSADWRYRPEPADIIAALEALQ